MDLKPSNLSKPKTDNTPDANNDNLTQHTPGHSLENSPPPSGLIQTLEPHNGGGLYRGTRSVQNRNRAKERRIKKLVPIYELFKDEKFSRYYVINFPDIDIRSELNVISVDSDLNAKIGKPQKITKLNKTSLLIQVKSEAQGKKVKQITSLAGIPVTCDLHRSLNQTKGTVLSETMTQCTNEELMNRLEEQGVIAIERMKTRRNGELLETNRYILTFNRSQLPTLIKLTDWHHEIVDLYVPPPRRCTKCHTFGHFRKWCKDTEDTCVRCGTFGHHGNTCFADPKCVNCGKDHAANDRECEIYKFRCEVMATMAKNHITHQEAMEIVQEMFREKGMRYSTVASSRINPRSEPQPERPTAQNETTPQTSPNSDTQTEHDNTAKETTLDEITNIIDKPQEKAKTPDNVPEPPVPEPTFPASPDPITEHSDSAADLQTGPPKSSSNQEVSAPKGRIPVPIKPMKTQTPKTEASVKPKTPKTPKETSPNYSKPQEKGDEKNLKKDHLSHETEENWTLVRRKRKENATSPPRETNHIKVIKSSRYDGLMDNDYNRPMSSGSYSQNENLRNNNRRSYERGGRYSRSSSHSSQR